MIHDSTDRWPFPEATGRRKDWTEIREADAEQLHECVPPIGGWDCFYVGEPADYDGDGVPVHSLIITRGARYFMLEARATSAAREAAKLDLTRELLAASAAL